MAEGEQAREWTSVRRITGDGHNIICPDGLQIGPLPYSKLEPLLREFNALERENQNLRQLNEDGTKGMAILVGEIQNLREIERDLRRERDEAQDYHSDWERAMDAVKAAEADVARLKEELEAAWQELAEIDGHESLAKAFSSAIQRRNKEALQLDYVLTKTEAEAARWKALSEQLAICVLESGEYAEGSPRKFRKIEALASFDAARKSQND